MKRFLAIVLAFVIVLCSAVLPAFASDGLLLGSAASSEVPFDLVPPAYVTAVWLEEADSPTTTRLTYSLSNEMTTFFKNMENASLDGTIEQFMQNIGCDDIWMNIQIDWALDDVNDPVSGWHYTEYWDGDEYYGLGRDSEGNSRWSEWDVVDWGMNNATETVQDVWVTRGVPNDDRWNGNPDTHTPGVKDQLRPDQYTYNEELEELRIDYTQHTMYFRARFVVTIRRDGENDKWYFSDWSETASVGKDAEKYVPLTKADLPAPVITGLRMTDKDFNDNPVVAFTLTVPDKLAEDATKAEANGGGIVIEIEARVKGDAEFVGLQGDWIIKAGEMEAALFTLVNENRPNVPKDSIVELRCRYRYNYGDDEFYSDYSKIISFGTDDINQGGSTPVDGPTAAPDATNPPAPIAANTCPICHFCPQPLGLCIFIWIAIILLAVIIIIVIVVAVAKSRKKKK